jgi:hypothetical protein
VGNQGVAFGDHGRVYPIDSKAILCHPRPSVSNEKADMFNLFNKIGFLRVQPGYIEKYVATEKKVLYSFPRSNQQYTKY